MGRVSSDILKLRSLNTLETVAFTIKKSCIPYCTYLSSLNEVSLVIFLTGKLSASVRNSRHSSNFPWQILRLIPMPRWNTLRHLGAFGSTWTSWKTSRFQDKRVFEVSSPSVSSSSFLKWSYFSKVHIFWEGHKILWNLHPSFDCVSQLWSKVRWRFRKLFVAFSEYV